MKRLLGLGVLVAILIAALSSHSHNSTSTTAASEPATDAAAPVTAAAPAKHHGPPVHYSRCDQNISVGPATTCGFANNVFRAFAAQTTGEGSEPASTQVQATSPVTGKSYGMTCRTAGATTLCTGGKQARVRFPVHAAQVYTQPPAPRAEPAPSYGAEESGASPTPEPESEEPESSPSECTSGSYVNSEGERICSPETSPNGPPAGATAQCEDGTYSFSQHRSGTCSSHGGVATWL